MMPPRYIYLPPGVRAQGGHIDHWERVAGEMRDEAEKRSEKKEGDEVRMWRM
jgi:hypothetical protein